MPTPEFNKYLEHVNTWKTLQVQHDSMETQMSRLQVKDHLDLAKNTLDDYIVKNNLQGQIDEHIKFEFINPIANDITTHIKYLQDKLSKELESEKKPVPSEFKSAGPDSYKDPAFLDRLLAVNIEGKQERNYNQILSLYAVLAGTASNFESNMWSKSGREILQNVREEMKAKQGVTFPASVQMEALKRNFDSVRPELAKSSDSTKAKIGAFFGNVPNKDKLVTAVDNKFAAYEKAMYVPEAKAEPPRPSR